MSDRPASLAEALAALQADLPRIRKDARGQHGKYADLADITSVLLPKLAGLGLIWTCEPTLTSMFGDEAKFVLEYQLTHVDDWDGEDVHGWYPLGTGNPQQLGSAITYARRYCLCAVTGVAPDEDDDDGQAAADEYSRLRRQPPETDEHGAATRAELERMRTGPEPGTTRHQGTSGERNDWNEAEPGNDPLVGARKAMFALFRELDIVGQDAQLAEINEICAIDPPLTSRGDATLANMQAVNVILRRRRDKQRREQSGRG